VSWGKIKIDAKPVKVSADATTVFPIIMAQTFAQRVSKEAREKATSEAEALRAVSAIKCEK
jgi:deoxyhypusine synthase